MHTVSRPDPRTSPLTVPCPRCDSEMIAAVREPRPAQLKAPAEGATLAAIRLAVWRCITCGVESPRVTSGA